MGEEAFEDAVGADTLVFDKNERDPDDDLAIASLRRASRVGVLVPGFVAADRGRRSSPASNAASTDTAETLHR